MAPRALRATAEPDSSTNVSVNARAEGCCPPRAPIEVGAQSSADHLSA